MLTGARVGEVRTARFEQFNLDYVVWSKPASTTKQRKIHLLGHSQMQTTQRYAHLMDSPLRAGVDTVASLLRPRPRLVHDADQENAALPKSA